MTNNYFPNLQSSFQQYPYQQYNPYQQQQHFQQQRRQVDKVYGEEGAKKYFLPPNSSVLLLDETAPIVWLKMTDSAGYPTHIPYDITPHEEKIVNQKSLEDRVTKIEEYIKNEQQSNIEPSQQPIKRIVKQNKSN